MTTGTERIPLAAAAGEELRALLAPLAPETFVHEYWAKKSLLVKGFPAKYAGFFDREAFGRALAPGPVHADFLRASFDRKTESGTSATPRNAGELHSTAFRASLEQAVPLFDAGATLCVSQIETRVPSLVPFLGAVKRQLGYPGKVSFNAYLSPPGSGFNWHFDSRIASTLQIEGTKVWRFSERPALAWPRGNGSLRADGTPRYAEPGVSAQEWERLLAFDPRETTEVLLEPGDLLILPAGVWHEACGGSGGSLALNLTFSPLSYTVLVSRLLDALLGSDAAWRGPAPLLPAGAGGAVDPRGLAAIAAQLARAAGALGALDAESPEVLRLWASLVQNPNPATPLPPAPPLAATPVTPDQRLRIREERSLYALAPASGTRLCLVAGSGRELELTDAAAAFVRRILAEREFVARDCTGWSDDGTPFAWSDVETMLTSLKREGVIEEIGR